MSEIEEIETISATCKSLAKWESIESDGVVEKIYSRDFENVLINGKPYFCGCGRRFSKKSFDAVLSTFNKATP